MELLGPIDLAEIDALLGRENVVASKVLFAAEQAGVGGKVIDGIDLAGKLLVDRVRQAESHRG